MGNRFECFQLKKKNSIYKIEQKKKLFLILTKYFHEIIKIKKRMKCNENEQKYGEESSVFFSDTKITFVNIFLRCFVLDE